MSDFDNFFKDPGAKVAIGLVMMGVAIIVAVTFVPMVADRVAVVNGDTNVTGSSKTLLSLLPLLLVVGLVAGSLYFIVNGIKGMREA